MQFPNIPCREAVEYARAITGHLSEKNPSIIYRLKQTYAEIVFADLDRETVVSIYQSRKLIGGVPWFAKRVARVVNLVKYGPTPNYNGSIRIDIDPKVMPQSTLENIVRLVKGKNK